MFDTKFIFNASSKLNVIPSHIYMYVSFVLNMTHDTSIPKSISKTNHFCYLMFSSDRFCRSICSSFFKGCPMRFNFDICRSTTGQWVKTTFENFLFKCNVPQLGWTAANYESWLRWVLATDDSTSLLAAEMLNPNADGPTLSSTWFRNGDAGLWLVPQLQVLLHSVVRSYNCVCLK